MLTDVLQLHQKMDSIAFTQERMKRQMDALQVAEGEVLEEEFESDVQEKVSGAPSDIGDIRDRMEVGGSTQ